MTSVSAPRTRPLRIGCASGFWGDSQAGAAQLVAHGDIDYLVFDYLAEITMALLARARAKSPEAGYTPDFVPTIAALAPQLRARGIKVVSNAGGMNPRACAAALATALAQAGCPLRIGVVEGDDLLGQADALRAAGTREMATGAPMPSALLSANAYLGAQPIAAALAAGADIVITGRVVDSAVTLAPLVHEFGWSWTDWDKLATGSLAGHLIECGMQCTGGIYTDWQQVPGWEDMGFPVAECNAEGTEVVITKPPGTGGLVVPGSVGEQLLYEIGDPARYWLPDVCCDFTQVRLAQDGEHRVRITGARGTAAPTHYKVSATWGDGWRLLGTLMVGGRDAATKAERTGHAILQRCQRLLAEKGITNFTETSLEVLGAESTYGPHTRQAASREVVLKLAARHPRREALELLAREIAPSATAMAQGITGFAAGRPSPSPVVRLFSCLVPRAQAPAAVRVEGEDIGFRPQAVPNQAVAAPADAAPPPAPEPTPATTCRAPLLAIAHGRSGDKGDMSNIGILARSEAAFRFLQSALTPERVATYMAHVAQGPVRRYTLPGSRALNFTLERALGGGGVASLRYDPQGKALAQMLLDMELDMPAELLEERSE